VAELVRRVTNSVATGTAEARVRSAERLDRDPADIRWAQIPALRASDRHDSGDSLAEEAWEL